MAGGGVRIATISAAIMCRRRTIHAFELEADNRSVIVIKVCWRPSVRARGSARNNWLGTPTLWPKLPSLGPNSTAAVPPGVTPALCQTPTPSELSQRPPPSSCLPWPVTLNSEKDVNGRRRSRLEDTPMLRPRSPSSFSNVHNLGQLRPMSVCMRVVFPYPKQIHWLENSAWTRKFPGET